MYSSSKLWNLPRKSVFYYKVEISATKNGYLVTLYSI